MFHIILKKVWLLWEWFVLLTWVYSNKAKHCTYTHCRNAIHKQIHTSTDLTIHGLLKWILIERGAQCSAFDTAIRKVSTLHPSIDHSSPCRCNSLHPAMLGRQWCLCFCQIWFFVAVHFTSVVISKKCRVGVFHRCLRRFIVLFL